MASQKGRLSQRCVFSVTNLMERSESYLHENLVYQAMVLLNEIPIMFSDTPPRCGLWTGSCFGCISTLQHPWCCTTSECMMPISLSTTARSQPHPCLLHTRTAVWRIFSHLVCIHDLLIKTVIASMCPGAAHESSHQRHEFRSAVMVQFDLLQTVGHEVHVMQPSNRCLPRLNPTTALCQGFCMQTLYFITSSTNAKLDRFTPYIAL